MFEVDWQGNVVWDFRNNFGVSGSGGGIFRAPRYAPGYPAFDGKKLASATPARINESEVTVVPSFVASR